jgi:hypothetical protein
MLARARRRRDDSRVNVRRIGIAGAVIVAVVAGISVALALRDSSITPAVDWSSPVALPSPTRSDLRSELVSDEQGFRFLPRTGHLEPNVAYVFDTVTVASDISPTSTAASAGRSTRHEPTRSICS